MSLLSDIDIEAENDRLRRYRDAQCESEYEFPEPVIQVDRDLRAKTFIFTTVGVAVFWTLLAVLALQ